MKVIKEIISWGLHIGIAIVLAFGINAFIIQPTKVVGCSMESTLQDGDRVYVNKLFHTLKGEPEYNDIVIIDSRVSRPRTFKDDITENLKNNIFAVYFTKNQQDHSLWIKRVIGKSGDVLEFKDGKIIRNGEKLDETYIKEIMDESRMGSLKNNKITVPKGHVFVMGDNRNNSMDSRIIGTVPVDHILGKYIFKL